MIANFIEVYTAEENVWVKDIFMYILPFWAFFLLNTPHDCFRCLGKDPDRPFSITQYKRHEIFDLKMTQKYGNNYKMLTASTEQSGLDLEVRLGT